MSIDGRALTMAQVTFISCTGRWLSYLGPQGGQGCGITGVCFQGHGLGFTGRRGWPPGLLAPAALNYASFRLPAEPQVP